MTRAVADSVNPPPRSVAIVANALAPYRIPLLNRLAQLPGVRLRALLGEESERFREWHVTLADAEFEWQIFPGLVVPLRTRLADQTGLYFSPHLWKHLARERYDLVIVLGWTMPNTMLALLIRSLRRLPIVLWDTSIPHAPSRLKRLLAPAIRRYFAAFDGYLAASSLSSEYMLSCGARPDRVVLLPQAIDNEFFRARARVHRADRETFKAQLGLAGRRVILYVGQFTERKGLRPLLEAFRVLSERDSCAALLLVGNGPLQQELLHLRALYHLDESVILHEFVQKDELPQYYAASDVFVLPSYYDTYGVVVNEAMASGLPIVTTHGVGSAKDLVQEGTNGFIVPAGSAPPLARALETILENEPLRVKMGSRSQEIISTWTTELAAQNFAKCLSMCIK